mgnify:FL=1
MGKQCIFLKNGIQLPFIRRKIRNIFTVKDYLTAVGNFKSAQNTKRRCFAAAARTKQGQKFIFTDIKVQIIQNGLCTVGF